MVLDYQGCIPNFASITDGKVHESKMVKLVHFLTGSMVVFDREYVDYKWFQDLDSNVLKEEIIQINKGFFLVYH